MALHACQRRSCIAARHSRPVQACRAPLRSGLWTARLPAANAGEPHSDTSDSDTSAAQEELQDSKSAANSHTHQQQDLSSAAEHTSAAAIEASPQGTGAGSVDGQHSSQAAGQDSIPAGSFPSPADVNALLNSMNSLPKAERQQYIRRLSQAVQADEQQPGPDGKAPEPVEQQGDRQRRQGCFWAPLCSTGQAELWLHMHCTRLCLVKWCVDVQWQNWCSPGYGAGHFWASTAEAAAPLRCSPCCQSQLHELAAAQWRVLHV